MIITSQASVGGTAVPLALVPPGPSQVTVINGGTTALYIGAGTSVTTSNGAPIPAGLAVPIPGFPASSPVRLWGITAGAAVTAGVIISDGS